MRSISKGEEEVEENAVASNRNVGVSIFRRQAENFYFDVPLYRTYRELACSIDRRFQQSVSPVMPVSEFRGLLRVGSTPL